MCAAAVAAAHLLYTQFAQWHVNGVTIVSMARDMQILASGRTADVYVCGDDAAQVLKLFKPAMGRGAAEHEHRIAHAVFACGATAPKPGALITEGDRTGLIYQRIIGRTLLSVLPRQPWRIVSFARLMARLHAATHQCTPTGLPGFREVITARLSRTGSDDASLCRRGLAELATLPEGASLCHGDFHPDNIMLGPGGAVVIDWNDAYAGHPLSDVARTSWLLRGSPPVRLTAGLRAVLAVRKIFHAVYLAHYLQLSGFRVPALRPFARVSAIARLADNIPGERTLLLREIAL
jgi:aminoglycoside phosphotransferase (APT) family kinase protein